MLQRVADALGKSGSEAFWSVVREGTKRAEEANVASCLCQGKSYSGSQTSSAVLRFVTELVYFSVQTGVLRKFWGHYQLLRLLQKL